MRIFRFAYRPWTMWGLIAALGLVLAPLGVMAVEQPAPTASDAAQAPEAPVAIPPVVQAEPYEAAGSDGDGDSVGSVAGGGGNCVAIGSFLTRAPGNSTLRGNMFRVLTEATVSAFGFVLDIDEGQPKALYFSVHRVPSGGGATFTRVIDDIVMNEVGTGDPELYTTGDLPMPVQLDLDAFYVFAVSWGGSGVATGRNPAQSSTPGSVLPGFPVATYIGEANVPLPGGSPPIDPNDNGVVMFAEQSAPWASEICLAGACCLGNACEELSEGACQSSGGSFTNAGQTCDQLMAEGLGCPLTLGACCTSNQACSQTSKFTCEDLGGEDWFQGEACNPTICIPTGACCVGNGECSEVREAQCVANGGFYRGDDTTCTSVEPRCTVGACCFGEACSVLSANNCNIKEGSFQGHGVACTPDNPCLPTGACCQGTSCSEVSEAQCGGSYRGDDTTCANLEVPCGRGACCSDAGCFQTTLSTCNLVGTFEGEGTSCATIFPPCDGTCCWEGGCEDDIDPLSCAGADGLPNGLFVGYDDSCSDDPCDTPPPGGACCLDTGDCVTATSATCGDLQGAYSGDGSTCDSITCLPVLAMGACCIASNPDLCVELTEDDCDTVSGVYFGGGSTCNASIDCDRGACCLPQGGCAFVIPSECDELNGEYNAGMDCTSGICPDGGACCLLNGNCTPRRDIALCDGLGGVFLDGMACIDVNCTRGACCLESGDCEVRLEANCLLPDEFRGQGTICPDSCEVGACCLPDTCIVTDRFDCTNLGGVFQLDVDCAMATCPPGGACCLSDESCEVRFPEDCISPARYQGNDTLCDGVCAGACCVNGGCLDDTELVDCTSQGGVFFGATACASDVCNTERGACCRANGSCDVVFDVQCTGEEDVFRGVGTTCAQACDPGACCLDDGTCEDTDNLSCDQILGAVFQPNNLCADDNCPGACCTGSEFCIIASRSVCESGQGAAFVGAATDCTDAAQCALGACCHLDGTCVQDFAFECDALFDQFAAGVDCGSVECTTRGACCVDGACSEVTPDECAVCSGGPNDGETCKSDEDCGTCSLSDEPCAPQTPCAAVCSHDSAVPCDTSDDCVETGMCIAQTCDTKAGTCEFDGSECTMDTDCNDVCTNDSNTSCTMNDDCTLVVGTCEQQSCDGGDCGQYFGDGVECVVDACAGSACCMDDGSCQDTLNELPYSAMQCTLDGGHPIANSDCDAGVCPPAGACCFGDNDCQQLTEAACIEMDGIYAGDESMCDGFVCALDACCLLDGSCTEELFGFQCTPDIGDPFGGFTCAAVEDGGLCSPRGACCDGISCSVQTEVSCINGGGMFQAVGLSCDPNPCQVCPNGTFVFHNPDGAADGNWYDARQPHELNDANMLQGRSVFMASGPEGAADLSCWELCETNNNPALHPGLAPNEITQVADLGGGSYEILLARPIAQAEVTRLRYLQSGDTAWFRYLPGDVNMDETSAPADILGVIDCLNGVAGFPCNLANTDTDRSAEAGPPDILRVIDLLNGASQLEVWLDAALDDSGCE